MSVPAAADPAPQQPAAFAERVRGIPGSVIDASTSLLQRQKHDIVRFAVGSPAAQAIPSVEFARIAAEVLGPSAADAFDYGPSEGESGLRTQLLEFLERQDGRPVGPERLLVTAGAMQGLDLACKLFVNPGDLVALEAPTYTNGSAVISSYGGEMLEVPVDGEGLDVDALEELAGARAPRVIYVIPNFQNPTGATLSLPRRHRLIELAERWESMILEDDPYRQLRFTGTDLPSLQQLAPDTVRVVRVETFSKILAPGLRIGWVVADPEVIRRMIDAKQGVDTCTNVPLQRLVGAFMARGLLDDHVRRVREEYGVRKRALQDALSEHLGDLDARWTDPAGGFFLWVTLPAGIDTSLLFPAALAEGVAFIPGRAFSAQHDFGASLRLCFAATNAERTSTGVRRLRTAILGALEQTGASDSHHTLD
jgi:2-aminoadipate transaminase